MSSIYCSKSRPTTGQVHRHADELWVDKSGKKFAPKIPARRAAATSATPVPATREPARQASQAQVHATPQASPPPVCTAEASPSASTQATESSAKQNTSPVISSETRQPPESSQAVRIPVPTRKPAVATPVPSPAAALKLPPQKPASTQSIQVRPILINVNSSRTRPTPSQDRQRTKSPELTRPASAEHQAEVRPAKRIRVSEPETRIQTPSRGSISSQPEAVSVPVPTASATPPADSTTENNDGPETSAKKSPRPRKPRANRTRSVEEIAANIVEDAVRPRKPRGRRKRESTPEDAEAVEIAPAVVKMSDLCRDPRTGKKSKREMELRNMEATELARKQKEKEEGRNSGSQEPTKDAGEKPEDLRAESDRPAEPQASGPQMRIVNGEIVLDTSTLQLDRHADAARNAVDMEEVIENTLTRKINQATYGKRTKYEAWDEDLTDLFYKGLRMFGTDFMMISKMFPGRTRRHIKLKFSNEERKYPDRIRQTLLGPREAVDLEAYSEMTNTIYDDPKIIQEELDAEKQRIEHEHAKEKEAREEQLRNPNGVMPSIENGADTKRGRNQKKKASKAGKFGGGTEEILGTIDDF